MFHWNSMNLIRFLFASVDLKSDVRKTTIFPISEALRANLLVLRTYTWGNYQLL